MAVDRGYGTGSVKPTPARSGSASLRKKGVKAAARKYTKVTTSKAKSVAGSSEYVQRENAARTQLGTAGVAARARQLPTAARASLREMTGVDISRKGVSVDPIGLAMAVSPFKLLKASKALRAAGQIDRALGVEARVAAKALGGSRKAKGLYPGKAFLGETGQAAANRARQSSEFVFPRLPNADIPGSRRSFDVYEDPLLEGAGRFKSQNLLESMIQGSKSRSGMNRVKTASEVAKKLAKYRTPGRGR